jgi:glycogen debranching enzyme
VISQSGDRSWEYLPDIFGGVESISDAHIIRERGLFLLTDDSGNVPIGNKRGLGLYYRDTRHLSGYTFTLNGSAPVVLLSTSDSGYSIEQVLGNYRAVTGDGHVVGRCTVEVSRQRILSTCLEERLRITNYNPFPVRVQPSYTYAADFADIFEVRGHTRVHPGRHDAPEVSGTSVRYRYEGADGVRRSTLLVFDREPEEITASGAAFAIDLGARESVELRLRAFVEDQPPAVEGPELTFEKLASDHTHWRESFTRVITDNEIFDKVLDRSFTDLRMLWSEDRQGNRFFAAGTPWFDALFGRDSLIAALQMLPFRPDLARDTLLLLAKHQGARIDPFAAEEPGKILHELREDELSAIGELPYRRYYGSVDSTPLFLLLAGEYYHWTADLASLRRIETQIRRALEWVRHYGAPDDDGYLKYETSSSTGLRNQGWKDSENCIVHEDGSLCSGRIALAEVQGYFYAAMQRLAPVFAALGDAAESSRLILDASALGKRFRDDFWLKDRRLVPMALDGEMRPAAVMSSNAGQVLWSGILERDQAEGVRDGLFGNDMCTGWGIRTITSENPAFNPVGYHLGTIWPHDNAIVAAGLKRHGFDAEVLEIATGIFDTACSLPSFRLPEVYGGHPRSVFQPPVPYPVACRPQAWAAGAVLHIVSSMLGLAADAANHRLFLVRPQLPYWLGEVHLRGLRVGRGSVDVSFRRLHGRTRAHVESAGGVTVTTASSWPWK